MASSSLCLPFVPLFVLHFLMKPGFRHPQVPADGNRGHVQRLGDLFHGEPPEIAEFDGFALSRIDLLEGSKTAVKGHEVPAPLLLKAHGLIQWHFDPRPLTRVLPARVVHQDLAHQARRHTEEMRAALPGRIALIDEPHVGLMDKRGGLQRVPQAFLAQVAGGQSAKFPINQGREVIKSLLVPLCPLSQQ
jgi:hypothetical protein